jgi:hypothetical protein
MSTVNCIKTIGNGILTTQNSSGDSKTEVESNTVDFDVNCIKTIGNERPAETERGFQSKTQHITN